LSLGLFPVSLRSLLWPKSALLTAVSSRFAYVVNQSVMHVFADCKARERHELLQIFRHLAANPHQRGDYVQRTASLREIQVKRFGKWLVTDWPDSAVGELRVVDMRKLVP
jgi:hypothetical protein